MIARSLALAVVLLSTILKPVRSGRDEDLFKEALMEDDPEAMSNLETVGRAHDFFDASADTDGRIIDVKENDVTESHDSQKDQHQRHLAQVEARNLLLQGVQNVLQTLQDSARINYLNLKRLQQLHDAFQREKDQMWRQKLSNETGLPNASDSEDFPVLSGKEHQHAKYELKQSTDGLEGLGDVTGNVETSMEDAEQKAKAVDKDFTRHQARIKDLGAAIDHLAISAEKYQLEVLHFFAKQEEAEKFSPLAKAAAGV
eukprot:symbB.v1.2.028066.t1/scaffold2935.1/size102186/6